MNSITPTKSITWLLIRSYLLFIAANYISAIIYTLIREILGYNENSMAWAGVGYYLIFLVVFLGVINTMFVGLLYLLNIDNQILLSKKAAFIEGVLYFAVTILIGIIIDGLPAEYKYTTKYVMTSEGIATPESYQTLKNCLSDEFRILYAYIILILIYLIKKICIISYKKYDV